MTFSIYRINKSTVLLLFGVIGLLNLSSCVKDSPSNLISEDYNTELLQQRNDFLDKAINHTQQRNDILNKGSFLTLDFVQNNGIGSQPTKTTVDCNSAPDCTDGGIRFLEAFPSNPNYRWRIDIIRTSPFRKKCEASVTEVNEFDWCISDQSDVTILADPTTAQGLIQSGFPNVISCVPNVAYQFDYHSNHIYHFLGVLSPAGDGTSSPDAYIGLDLYDANGTTSVKVYDLFENNGILPCWATSQGCSF